MNNEKLRQKIDSDLQEDSLQYPNLEKLSNPQKIEIKCKISEKTKLKDQKVKVVIQNPKNSEKSLLSNQINHFIIPSIIYTSNSRKKNRSKKI